MNKYIGTKLIEAKEMNLGDYNNYRGWKISEDENSNREGYLVKYEEGYELWSSKEVFKKAYNDINKCMSFGQAIEMMKIGYKVSREGWNGKGMFIYIQKNTVITKDMAKNEVLKEIDGDITINSHIDMKTADGSICIGWLASQTDMLSNDWAIVE